MHPKESGWGIWNVKEGLLWYCSFSVLTLFNGVTIHPVTQVKSLETSIHLNSLLFLLFIIIVSVILILPFIISSISLPFPLWFPCPGSSCLSLSSSSPGLLEQPCDWSPPLSFTLLYPLLDLLLDPLLPEWYKYNTCWIMPFPSSKTFSNSLLPSSGMVNT